jgi:hypothetical protein
VIAEHEVVELLVDLPAEGITAGTRGTVVHVHPHGVAYEVEAFAADGSTIAVVTVTGDQITRRDVR